jgi:hypothetical protein
MSMESHPSSAITDALARRVEQGAAASQVADMLVSTWQEIDTALGPIIGQRGVAALYKRSLFLTGAAHPWLAAIHGNVRTSIDFAALKSVLVQQGSADAAAGGGALLHTFHELLTSLVGPSLTERLLRSVWANALGTSPAQDTSS